MAKLDNSAKDEALWPLGITRLARLYVMVRVPPARKASKSLRIRRSELLLAKVRAKQMSNPKLKRSRRSWRGETLITFRPAYQEEKLSAKAAKERISPAMRAAWTGSFR